MTIAEQTPSDSYVADGIEDTFTFNFRLLQDEDLVVEVDDVLQTLNTDYTIENQLLDSGDAVFAVPPADTLVVSLVRNTSQDQDVVYTPFDPFPAKTHEGALDKLTMITQESDGRFADLETEVGVLETELDAHVADIDIHFGDAPANGQIFVRQDNAWESPDSAIDTQWLRLDGANSPLTGPLATQLILADTDQTRDIGLPDIGTNRFNNIFGRTGIFVNGDKALDLELPNNVGTGGIIIGSQVGAGVSTHRLQSDFAGANVGPLISGGRIQAQTGATSRVEAGNSGAIAIISSFVYSGDAVGKATAIGSLALGYIGSRGYGLIHAQGNCSFAMGNSSSGPAGVATNKQGIIRSVGNSSFAHGRAHASNTDAYSLIEANGNGAFSKGNAEASTGGNAQIKSGGGSGSFAMGSANASTGTALIEANGNGAFAMGYAAQDESIQALGDNAVQFGVGVNAEAGTLAIGVGPRFKGTEGPPSVIRTGDVWVENGEVFIEGPIVTKAIRPDTPDTHDIGSTSSRYQHIFGEIGVFVNSVYAINVTLPGNTYHGGIIGGSQSGPGTTGHIFGNPFSAVMCLGNANTDTTTGAGGTAIVQCIGGGAVVLGGTYTRYDGLGILTGTGYGSMVLGYSNSYYATSEARVESYGQGSMAIGYCVSITADSAIRSYGPGSFAGGHCYSGFNIANQCLIKSEGAGSIAFGNVQSGNVTAGNILALGKGSFALGHALSEDIEALGDNSVQIGVGSNAEPVSLQVGTGIRINGTLGVPVALKDGDIWLVGTDVFIRSGGVSVQIT